MNEKLKPYDFGENIEIDYENKEITIYSNEIKWQKEVKNE